MTKKNIYDIVLDKVNPSKETIEYMQKELDIFLTRIKKRISKYKIDAEPFVGGSFAKKTLVSKSSYDIDLFIRYGKKHQEKDFSKLTKKIIGRQRGVKKVHGSRDYYQVSISAAFMIEVVPTRKVSNPKESENITDLSYLHVKYINKKIKSQKILDEIKIAKAFFSANEIYGAESYVHGFSGYAIELLVYKFGTFEKMLKELTKKNKKKIIIDMEKLYKNETEVMIEMNGSKLLSPIILIDPTFKERNALAALSDETFEKFKVIAKNFLKNKSEKFFSKKQINLDELKKTAKENGDNLIVISTKTKKQDGDIAGTKLLKFHNHLVYEMSRYFEILEENFRYEKNKMGKAYLILKNKDYILFPGPKKDDLKNIEKFKKEHEKIYEENGRLFAKEKMKYTPKAFLKEWGKKNKKKIKQMYITRIKII